MVDVALFRQLERRYRFTGDLVLHTALHIGGGDAAIGSTDSPVVRQAGGLPFIPGSSLKGAVRSTVEKLAATLGLANMDHDVLDTGSTWLRTFHERRRKESWDEERTVREVALAWPATATLFGTQYTASKITFSDAYLRDDQDVVIQRRDGVAIDRDSERAMDQLKYDYEVVPPTLRFGFELLIDNPTDTELGLACLGLNELRSGFISLGGKRSSGLGRCAVEELRGFALDLRGGDTAQRMRSLTKYLRGSTPAEKLTPLPELDRFIAEQIEALVAAAMTESTRDHPEVE